MDKSRAFDTPTFVALLAVLAAMNALSVEIVLPAIVPIAAEFQVREEDAAMLIGAYFLSYAVGQILWGLLSDAFGRKSMMLVGLSGYLGASVLASIAQDFTSLLLIRIIQGGFGAAPIIANAIVRDISSGAQAARTQSVLAATISVAPLVAPALGSGILVLADWRMIFVCLAVVSAVLIAMTVASLPETLTERRPERLRPSFVVRRVGELYRTPVFRYNTLVTNLSFGGFASVLAMGSVVAENAYEISPEAFGSVYAVIAVATLVGVFAARALMRHLALVSVGAVSVAMLALAVLAHLALVFTEPVFAVFWGHVALYLFAFGMIFPTFTSIALDAAGATKGFAASIKGALNMVFGFLCAVLVTTFYDGTFRTISIAMIGFGTLSVLSFFLGYRYSKAG